MSFDVGDIGNIATGLVGIAVIGGLAKATIDTVGNITGQPTQQQKKKKKSKQQDIFSLDLMADNSFYTPKKSSKQNNNIFATGFGF